MMKHLSKIMFIAILSLMFFSCSEEENIEFDNSALIENLKNEAIKFEKLLASKNLTSKTNQMSNFNSITQEDVQGMVDSSIELIKSYGITDAEIIEEFGGLDNPGIVEAGLAIAQIENQADYGVEMIDIETDTSLLTGEDYALTFDDGATRHGNLRSDVYDCALQAAGITAIGELISNGIKNMSKSAVKKVLKKVATKYLGWVGAAVAVYEFGDCMEWW